MARFGLFGPISTGSPAVTTSPTGPRSLRWPPRWSVRSPRPSPPNNSGDILQRQHAMSVETFDVVILGGGNGGIGVTGPVRRAGMSVAMIESHELGGTCPNRGCTPKKVLV